MFEKLLEMWNLRRNFFLLIIPHNSYEIRNILEYGGE